MWNGSRDIPGNLPPALRAHVDACRSNGLDLLPWIDPYRLFPSRPITRDLDRWAATGVPDWRLRAAQQVIDDCDLFDVSDLRPAVVRRYLNESGLSQSHVGKLLYAVRAFAGFCGEGGTFALSGLTLPDCVNPRDEPEWLKWALRISQRYDNPADPVYGNTQRILEELPVSDFPRQTKAERERSLNLIKLWASRARRQILSERYGDDNKPAVTGSNVVLFSLFFVWFEAKGSPTFHNRDQLILRCNALPEKVRIMLGGWEWKLRRKVPSGPKGREIVDGRIRKGKAFVEPPAEDSGDQRGRFAAQKHREGWTDKRIFRSWNYELTQEDRDKEPLGNPKLFRSVRSVGYYRRQYAERGWGPKFHRQEVRPNRQRDAKFLEKFDELCVATRGRVLSPQERSRYWKPLTEYDMGSAWWNALPEAERAKWSPENPGQIGRLAFALGCWKAWCEANPFEALPILQSQPTYRRDQELLRMKRTRGGRVKALDCYDRELTPEQRESLYRGHPEPICKGPGDRRRAARLVSTACTRAEWVERIQEQAKRRAEEEVKRKAEEEAKRKAERKAVAGQNGKDATSEEQSDADRSADGPLPPDSFRYEGIIRPLDLQHREFMLLSYVWEALGGSDYVEMKIPELGKAVWQDRHVSYGTMKPRVFNVNKALLSAEVPYEVKKPRRKPGESEIITFCRIRTSGLPSVTKK